MAALPPSTTGQPTPWPSAVSRRPKADVNGAVSGSMACAAAPARRARPASVVKRRVAWRSDGAADHGEAGQRQRVTGDAPHRTQHIGDDAVEPLHHGPHQVAVGRRVTAQVRCRLLEAPVQGDRPRATQRLGEGHLGLAQDHAEAGEVQGAEEGRGDQRRVHRRADVVAEPLERERLGARPAPHGRRTLEHLDAESRPGQRERCGKAVGPRAHDDRVRPLHTLTLPTAIEGCAGAGWRAVRPLNRLRWPGDTGPAITTDRSDTRLATA